MGAVVARLLLAPAVLDQPATKALSEFSHIKVVFQFHQETRVRRDATHPRGNPARPRGRIRYGSRWVISSLCRSEQR